MSTRRTENAILTAKRSPQIAIMHKIIKYVQGPFRRAVLDIQMNRVRKESTNEEAKTVQTKVTEIFINELKQVLQEREMDMPILSSAENIPAEDGCFLVNAGGSLVNLGAGRDDVCLALAYAEDGVVQSAVIYFPVTDKLYIAEKGQGVEGPDLKLRVAGSDSLENMVVSFFSPVSSTENEDEVLEMFTKLRKMGAHIRISGNTLADALDFAAGQTNAYIGYNLSALDVMIAELIIRESGGYTCEVDGSKVELGSKSIIAAGAKLQGKLLKKLTA